MGRPAPAQVLKVVRDLLRQTDRGALADDDLRLALRSLLSPDAAHGAQTPVDFHTPRRPSPRMQDLAKNRSVRRRLADYIEQGVEQGGETFYDTRPMRAMFHEAGASPQDFNDFIGVNAAMSPQSRVPEQIRRAGVVYGRHKRGEGVPWLLPEGYGHFLYRTNQRRLAENVLSGKGLNPKTGAKTAAFRENLLGNLHPEVATIDKHATSLPAILSGDPRWLKHAGEPVQYGNDENFVPRRALEQGEIDLDEAFEQPNWWGGKPLDSEYRAFVQLYRELGQKAGLNNPAAAQAAAWRGGAHITGVESPDAPFVVMFADRVLELAKKHGLSFREALATVARGDRELLGIAAGAPILMSALMDEDETS